MIYGRIRAGLVLGVLSVVTAAWSGGCSSSPSTLGSSEDVARKRGDAAKLASRGHEAQLAGRIDEAISLYSESLDTFGDLPGVRTNLGVALLTKKDLLAASDILKDEVRRFPAASQQALTNLGVIHLEQGWAEQARDFFSRAVDLAPNEPAALRGVIVSGMLTGADEKQTLEYIRRAQLTERDPKVLEDYRWRQVRLQDVILNKPKYNEVPEDPSKIRQRPKRPAKTPPVSTPPATQPDSTPPAATPPAHTDPGSGGTPTKPEAAPADTGPAPAPAATPK